MPSNCVISRRYAHVKNGKVVNNPQEVRNGVKNGEVHWAWLDAGREIPPGMQLNHYCDNPRCVNIDHVYLGTQKDNVHDAFNRGRRDMRACHAKVRTLTEENVREMRHLVRKGWTITAAGKKFNLSQSAASNVVNRVSYSDVRD